MIGLHGLRRARLRRGVLVLAGVVASIFSTGVAGCGTNASSGAPPTVVCGTVLSGDTAAGPTVFSAWEHLPTIKGTTVGGVLIFRVARGCDTGAHVTWVPSSAAHLVKAVYARDGQMVAVVLRPSGPHAAFRLIATRNGKTVASATVKLG